MQHALVIGGSGFVGRSLFAHLGAERAIGTWNNTPADQMIRFDAVNESAAALLARLPSDISHVFVLFGTVNPDRCAADPDGTAETNVNAVIRLIGEVLNSGRVPVFVSTDYVFDGAGGLRTEDEPQSPNTEYGRQKTAVEQWLQSVPEPWLITRLSKVVNGDPATHSVLGQWVGDIKTGKPMRSATDQVFSPALVDDISDALISLAEQGQTGVFHVAGREALSRYELNRLLVDAVNEANPHIAATVEPCSLRDIPFREKRPLNTSLSVAKLQPFLKKPFCRMADLCTEIARTEFSSTVRRTPLIQNK